MVHATQGKNCTKQISVDVRKFQFPTYLVVHIAYREECSTKGGVNSGSCASGFGVCCTCKIFLSFKSCRPRPLFLKGLLTYYISNYFHLITVTIGCGATTRENCTYFESSNLGSGACRSKICPCSDDICQVLGILKSRINLPLKFILISDIRMHLILDFNTPIKIDYLNIYYPNIPNVNVFSRCVWILIPLLLLVHQQ